jgi:short subunit dehydrogenase-like uncharacterized protein
MAEASSGDKPFLLYGANGYTGELLAEEAVRSGMRPILAGRNEQKVAPIAERLGTPMRIFDLSDPDAVERALEDVELVLLAAGPFSRTSAPVVDACLRTKTHYLDITGEVAVFEAVHARDADAVEAGVTLLPGVGFDVVPSDCLAASLSEALPEATRLLLAFHGVGAPSRGTLKTMVEGIAEGGAVRKAGKIEKVPTAWKSRTIPFRDKPRFAVTIPWGDVSTAYYSTGIGDIEVYMSMPQRLAVAAKLSRPFAGVLGSSMVKRFVEGRIDTRAKGPDADLRERGRSQLWGRVEAPSGRGVEGTLVTPEGYALTVTSGLECVRRVLAGRARSGALTPSMAFGARFITELPGTDLRIAKP